MSIDLGHRAHCFACGEYKECAHLHTTYKAGQKGQRGHRDADICRDCATKIVNGFFVDDGPAELDQ